MSEINTIRTTIWQTLSGDQALCVGLGIGDRIYPDLSPTLDEWPFIVYEQVQAHDVNGATATRLMSSALYLVRVIGFEGGFAAIDPIADRIDTLLHGMHQQLASGETISCIREQPYHEAEVDRGPTGRTGDYRVYCHAGGIYRFWVTN